MSDQREIEHPISWVSFEEIITKPEVFQFRHVEVNDRHVGSLVRVLKSGSPLDPLTIWRDSITEELVVADGHHRLAAYRLVDWKDKVPVIIHCCSLEEARLLALRDNSKTRLPLTGEERLDAAWALVRFDCPSYSRRTIVQLAGVSDGTVAKMRRARKELLGDDGDGYLPHHWSDALEELKGRERREYTDDDRQAMIDAKAAILDRQIGSALGFMVANQIESVFIVLEDRLGRQGVRSLLDHFGARYPDDDDDDFPF